MSNAFLHDNERLILKYISILIHIKVVVIGTGLSLTMFGTNQTHGLVFAFLTLKIF